MFYSVLLARGEKGQDMIYLVTGCAGFIGSAVADKLLAEGHTVTGVDNMSDYYSPLVKRRRLGGLGEQPQFRFAQRDITHAGGLDDLFRQQRFDAVLHLAALPGVRSSVAAPAMYYRTNTAGTLELLECCRRYDVGKFVLASTSAVYGGNGLPFRETDHTDSVLSPYAASKKAAEALCHTYHHLYGIDVGIARYFSVYGPSGRPDMIIPLFIRSLVEGSPVTVFGDGRQRRDFTFIDDIVDGTLRLLRFSGYGCFNLGSGCSVELLDVLRLVERFTGKPPLIWYAPPHPADAPATQADISKAHDLLGWSPAVDIEEGLFRTVAWHLHNDTDICDYL